VQENEESGNNSKAGASVQYEIRHKKTLWTKNLKKNISQNQTKIIVIDAYKDEDSIIPADDIDILSKRQHNSFHCIIHTRIETQFNNFKTTSSKEIS
jgi:predicted transcriptional regulator